MQPEIFLSVPLHGHAAASGQAKAQAGADDMDFGRVFARLKGDEIKRETSKIEALPSGRLVKAPDGEAEDAAIPDGEVAAPEDLEPLPDEAPPLEEGEFRPDQAAARADNAALPGEAGQRSRIVARPTAVTTDHPGDPGTTWRSSSGQVTLDPSKPATGLDLEGKRNGEGLPAQGPEPRLAAESGALHRSASMIRETEDPHADNPNARDSMGRHDAIPEPIFDEAPLTVASAGLKGPQSELDSEVRTEAPTFENRPSQGPTPVGEAIAPRQEVAQAPQLNPFAGHPETSTPFVDGKAANEEARPHIPDVRARVPELYLRQDGHLAGSPDGKSAVPTSHGAGKSDLPRLEESADVDPVDDANPTSALLSAMPATSNSRQAQVPGQSGLPIATETAPRDPVRYKTGYSSRVSSTRSIAGTLLNGGQDPGSDRVMPGGGQRIDGAAAAVQPMGRLAQTAHGATAPTGLAQTPVVPITMSPGPEAPGSFDGPVSPGLSVPGGAHRPSANRVGPGVAVQGSERQLYSPDLGPAEHKQGVGLPVAPAQGMSAVPMNVPRLPEGQNVAANEKVDVRSELPARPNLNTPAKALARAQDAPLTQPLKPEDLLRVTMKPERDEPILLSEASPEEPGPVDSAKTRADRPEPQGQRFTAASSGTAVPSFRPEHSAAMAVTMKSTEQSNVVLAGHRVAPSGGGNQSLETGLSPEPHAETRPAKSAGLSTSGQPWPSQQGSGEIVPQTGRTAMRYAGATEEGEALSKVNTGDQAVEIRILPRKDQDPKSNGLSRAGGGTGMVSVLNHRRPGPAPQQFAELPARRPAVIDHAQGLVQDGLMPKNGTEAELREVGTNPRGRPFATETPETGRNRLSSLSETGRHDALERRRAPHAAQVGDAGHVVSEDRTRPEFGLKRDRQSIRGSIDRLDVETTEQRQGAAEKPRPGSVQAPDLSESPPRLPNHAEDMDDFRNADRAETARPRSLETIPAQSTRSDEIARQPSAQGDMSQPRESPAKSLAGTPADVAMPRSLPETTGLVPRDIPTSDAPAPPSTAQHVALARDVAQQLSQVTRSVPGEVTELTLRPEELGHVRMRLSGSDGQIVLQILSERPETHDLMRRHIDIVERAFRDLGYHDIAFDFSFSGQRNGGPQTQGEPRPTEDRQIADVPPVPQAVRRQLLVPGRLDIRL